MTEFARPDLRIPLMPVSGPARAARRYFLGLRDAGFAGARRGVVAWAAAGCVFAVASIPAPSPWQRVVGACSAAVGLYAIAKAQGLVVAARRQQVFEREWLAAQSERLRAHDFGVLRLTLTSLAEDGGDPRRTYDLTSPADIRDLLRLRDEDETRARPVFLASVEFAFLGDDGVYSVADVHRDLREILFLPGQAGEGQAWIRFPEARYLPRPTPAGRPARLTFWSLSGPVVLSVSDAPQAGPAQPAPPEAPTGSSGLGSAR